jgi:hypothetical protein
VIHFSLLVGVCACHPFFFFFFLCVWHSFSFHVMKRSRQSSQKPKAKSQKPKAINQHKAHQQISHRNEAHRAKSQKPKANSHATQGASTKILSQKRFDPYNTKCSTQHASRHARTSLVLEHLHHLHCLGCPCLLGLVDVGLQEQDHLFRV